MKKTVNMLYPATLVERIDLFKEKKGFTTRTQAIIFLLQRALDEEEKTRE